MNLVTNAAQAIGSRPGTIELSLRREEAIAGTAASPHHGGRVTVASVPGEGTTFDIRLPLPAESVPLPDLESAT
jgi:nitrogen-specific signal transduction histidine kinase